MSEIKSLCVYCGSSVGADPAYREAAVEMGTLLAREGITLVFGGGKVGLMGTVADAALAAGGKVHGVKCASMLFETWTWGQLGWHAKPVALLDVAGFYAPLAGFLDHVVAQGFVQDVHRRMLLVDRRPADLLARLRAYVPPETPKWLGPDEI
jgi:predicted Rossmann-fold nucleotide-binding protein